MSTFREKLRRIRAFSWFTDRYPIEPIMEWASHKEVPMGKTSIWYYFGGVAVFLFLVQVATGILLMFYYKGSADTAYESVQFLVSKVPFGWLIRSVHSWAANLIILVVFIHMFSVFYMRAYKKPRELTWVTGILLLGILMGFGFSGYLLPWNELSFFATKVGTDMVGIVPVVGKPIMHILRGGEEVSGSTLPRFFALHVGLFPALLTTLMIAHLVFVQIQGMHEPADWKKHPEKRKTMPFFPHFALRDFLLWLVVFNVLAILAVFFPWDIGIKADPFAPAPAGIKPEWYFLATYQVLKLLPAKIGPIDGELVGLLGVSLVAMVWFFIPWIDRGRSLLVQKSVRVFGGLVLVFFVVFTILGHYLS